MFGETLVFGRLLEQTPPRRSLGAGAAGGVDRGLDRDGVPADRHEPLRGPRPHGAPRGTGELGLERFNALWARVAGGAARRRRGSDRGLPEAGGPTSPTSSPTPGYVYAYAYGQLLALAVYGRYEETGPEFVPAYLELLGAGGSRSPEELGAIVGVDLADPGFWDRGLDLVERQLEAAEAAAQQTGRLGDEQHSAAPSSGA